MTLLPCPFCGGSALGVDHPPHKHYFVPMPDHPGSYTIECAACNVGLIEDTKEKAEAAWNKRVPYVSLPQWLVRAGGDAHDSWLCATREDVRKAVCEALYGAVEDADESDIKGYMEDFDGDDWHHDALYYSFEDGSLSIIKLPSSPTISHGGEQG